MTFEFLKAYKLNKAVNDAMPIAEVCNTDIFESMDLLEDFDKEEILSYWERFKDMEWIREFYQAVEDFGETVVDSFIDIWSIDDVQYIGDAFQGYARSEAEFAEELGITLPSIVHFTNEIPNVYKGNMESKDEVLKWLIDRKRKM